jgi:hypothetical protein
VLSKKLICTEIYAQKENSATWNFGRRIVFGRPGICGIYGGHPYHPDNDVKKWMITENQMAHTLGHHRARKCFVDNHKFVDAKDKEGEQFLSMKKISANSPYLHLSNHIATKLGM